MLSILRLDNILDVSPSCHSLASVTHLFAPSLRSAYGNEPRWEERPRGDMTGRGKWKGAVTTVTHILRLCRSVVNHSLSNRSRSFVSRSLLTHSAVSHSTFGSFRDATWMRRALGEPNERSGDERRSRSRLALFVSRPVLSTFVPSLPRPSRAEGLRPRREMGVRNGQGRKRRHEGWKNWHVGSRFGLPYGPSCLPSTVSSRYFSSPPPSVRTRSGRDVRRIGWGEVWRDGDRPVEAEFLSYK